MTAKINAVFRITYVQDDEIIEIYAKQVTESDMFGFLVIEEILFGEKSTVVVDPTEERLKAQFNNVIRTYIPMHNVLRIDEVDKEGIAKITKAGAASAKGNVRHFPPSKS